MQPNSFPRALAALLVGGACLATVATAQITPAGITGTGTYFNSAGLLIDGVVPAENTVWTDTTNAYWDWTGGVSFKIDLGANYTLYDALLSVDNNDDYLLEYSIDGVSYTNLLLITSGMGEIAVSPGGMDTFASNPGHPEFDAGIAFAPVNARYLRASALNGDGLYAIGEVQVWGREIGGAVPEPSTYGLIGAAVLAGLVALRRRAARR